MYVHRYIQVTCVHDMEMYIICTLHSGQWSCHADMYSIYVHVWVYLMKTAVRASQGTKCG